MKRDVVITVLLVIAGIILAIVLFGAGVFWKGKTSPARSSQMVPAQHQIDKQVQLDSRFFACVGGSRRTRRPSEERCAQQDARFLIQ